MELKNFVIENRYLDSVVLMSVASKTKKMNGVIDVAAMMGTDSNKEVMQNTGMLTKEGKTGGPNDLILCIKTENSETFEKAKQEFFNILDSAQTEKEGDSDVKITSISNGIKEFNDANLVLFSIPGPFVKREADICLEHGKNVMIFSDNVTVEEEKYLKQKAVDKGLIVMGPDCGTSIINNVALAFANVVPKGPMGIIGASGTGIQEVSTLLAKKGYGLKHAIGLGGRDLSKEIGGLSMIQAMKALEQDDEIKVIILISKPPAPEIAEKVLKLASKSTKKIVVNFLKGDPETAEKYNLPFSNTLEGAANLAISVYENQEYKPVRFDLNDSEIEKLVEKIKPSDNNKKYLRGLYSGGTLADESLTLLSETIGDIYSNIPLKPELQLEDSFKSKQHTIVDLGEDEFTKGRPHPMIDYTLRMERMIQEAKDPETAVILLDIVTGYGSHMNPEEPLLETIDEINKINPDVKIVATICGTDQDPQNVPELRKKLIKAGVVIMPSNAQAARLCGLALK